MTKTQKFVYANIKGLDGFNVIRYEIYKLDGSEEFKEENLVEEIGTLE